MMNSRIWILGAPDPEMAAIESLLLECGETVAYAVVGVDRVHAGNAVRAERAHYPAAFVDEQRDPENMGHEAYPQTGRREYWIECDGLATRRRTLNDAAPELAATRIDHHRPGDRGYGRPPRKFLEASSIGQVVAELARLGVLPSSWPRTGGDARQRDPVGSYRFDGPTYGWSVAIEPENYHTRADVHRELVLTAAADHCLGAAYRGECPGVDPDELMRWRAV